MNRQYFSKEQIEAGELHKLLDYLMAEAYGAGEYYNDIHIKPEDCEAFTIEWEQVPWNHQFGGHFELIEEDQVVMIERTFPDNHTELCYDEEDFNERLKEFLEQNPGWVKTTWGTWTNEIENEKWKEYLKKEEAKKEESEEEEQD